MKFASYFSKNSKPKSGIFKFLLSPTVKRVSFFLAIEGLRKLNKYMSQKKAHASKHVAIEKKPKTVADKV